MRRKPDEIPAVIVLKPEEMQPSLEEAFARWLSMGEWPAGSILVRCTGTGSLGLKSYTDVCTGKRTDGKGRAYLTHVLLKDNKPPRFFAIFGPEGSEKS